MSLATAARTFARSSPAALRGVASRSRSTARRAVRTMAVSTEPAPADASAKTTEPRWDLSRHFGYDSPMSSTIDKELDAIEAQCKALKSDFEGKMDTELLRAIKAYEAIDIALTKCLTYVSLSSDTALDDDKAQKRKASLFQRYSTIAGNELTFFSLELAELSQDALDAQMAAEPEALGAYAAFIEETRRSQPYNLSKEVERALTVRAPFAGKGKVVEFYGNELSRLRFADVDGEEKVNMEVLLAKMTSSKDAATRAKCMAELNDGLREFERVAALSLNMVSGSWHAENTERGFKELRSQRNLGNNVPDEVVDSLLDAVRTTGVDYCKRYYLLKKAVLNKTQGLETFTWSDRNASIDIGSSSDTYTWDEAVEIVREGYNKFSPTMAGLFTTMVDEKRIDVPAQNGKRGGAYCSSSYGTGPFQLLNFTGTQRDVATLAHESGHGAHFMLSYEQGILQFHPPLTLAETASIFGEMIVFRDLLAKAPSDEDRLAMLMSKIDDIVNSVVRQCGFDAFEAKVHSKRAAGTLTPDEMTEAWQESMVEYYGEEGEVFDSYANTSHLWTYVSHFHNVPFYVYSYAFADLVVGSLYGVYAKTPDGFEEKLLDLLRAGGVKGFKEALEPFGLDPSEKAFWKESIDAHLGSLMEEAEALSKKLGYTE
jgi:oligoendopeptidase F